MKFSSLLVASIACGSVTASSTLRARRKAIAGGSSAGSGEADYFVLLGEEGTCGGSLIDESHVLTSASCIAEGAPEKVYIGATDRSNDPDKEYEVECGYIHEDYQETGGCNEEDGASDSDIAILRLKEPCKGCPTIALNTGKNDVAVGDTVKEYGMGRTGKDEDYSDKIQKTTTLEAVSDSDCQEAWGDLLPSNETNYFCANKDGGSLGYCDGDFGGPVVVTDAGEDTQVGVMIRLNDTCGDPDLPDVFTEVATYNDWIQDVLASDECNVDVKGCGFQASFLKWWNS